MKKIVLMITGIILGGLTLMIVMTAYGRMNYSMELKSNLPSAVEETVENMMLSNKYSINDTDEFLADFVQTLVISLDAKSDITVDILQCDREKGILTVKVTASFLHPNGKSGTVECERTVIFNRLETEKMRDEVIVAVLDTGYTGENERVINGTATIGEKENTTDGNGHGTRIAEMILDRTKSQVKILPVKIADNMGKSSETAAYEGIKYAIENNADIIHMSLNMSDPDKENKLTAIINEAITAGIDVVVSAGNGAKDAADVFPANIDGAIVVSAVDSDYEISNYSNYGSTVDFAAYGDYLGESGTSYSAARVTAMLAEEYCEGGNTDTLRNKTVDAGAQGKDPYYGYGVLATEEILAEKIPSQNYVGLSEHDIGYEILDVDWKESREETLDKYFAETNRAYVGMYLSRLDETELERLKEKSDILKSNVLVQDFKLNETEKKYVEVATYEEAFVENAIKEYQEYEAELSVSAEFLILKRYAYFAVSSANRKDIYYFQIDGFSYTTDTTSSAWFSMFNPDRLTVTRTTVQQSTDFGAVYVSELATYLKAARKFAAVYEDPDTGELVETDNLFAIDSGGDSGALHYGLAITMEGYSNQKPGYHTEEEDIISIPYDYVHAYEEYSYEEYKEPLTYLFSYYDASTNSTKFSTTPKEVNVQPKNFKRLVNVDQTIWYNGVYKNGYNYSKVDESLDLESKIATYLKSYSKKTISDINIYSTESSLTDTGFTINADLSSSLGIQWNNGETSTVAVRNDIPEYNFPLVPNVYEIVYDGNGATGGEMANTAMTYDEEKRLEVNQYSKAGYMFIGWSSTADGTVEYTDMQAVSNLTATHNGIVTLYAVWEPVSYIVTFDGNDATGGEMADMVMKYDFPTPLTKNSFTRSTEYGMSTFIGWGMEPDIGNPVFEDEEVVVNLADRSDAIVILHAVWDDCPWIVAEDLYYSLGEAQAGQITYEELMRHASAVDKEAGGMVLPGIDEEKGTSFVILDYTLTTYTQLQKEATITEIYQVIDSVGNRYEKEIDVHIVDTLPKVVLPVGTTRFISEKYYNEPYENGGLEENSVWKTDPGYAEVIQKAFENSRNDTPMMSFHFTYEEMVRMKEFVQVNGVGNSKSESALRRFYELFLAENLEN
ncbi:MAG: S8 family serine peptidase [Roseburia sp.]|nr:S8 family serine peptidase [Roseburia sp.]